MNAIEQRKQYQRDYYRRNKEKWVVYALVNPEKKRATNRKSYLKHRDKNLRRFRGYDLKYQYGITYKDYEDMLAEQGGVCAICGKEETKRNQYKVCSLSVDHDHETGQVRGLLCSRCNTQLGWYESHILWYSEHETKISEYLGGVADRTAPIEGGY